MGISLNDKLNQVSAPRRQSIEQRGQVLVEEALTLGDLRRLLEKTQAEVGQQLAIQQDGVSRLERRADLRVSTLVKFVDAMGGQLKMVAEFPDRAPVQIKGFGCSPENDSQ